MPMLPFIFKDLNLAKYSDGHCSTDGFSPRLSLLKSIDLSAVPLRNFR